MNIIKRSGEEVEYESDKIINAVSKANSEAPQELRLSDLKIRVIEDEVHKKLKCISHTPSIEEIQDLVINEIQKMQAQRLRGAPDGPGNAIGVLVADHDLVDYPRQGFLAVT